MVGFEACVEEIRLGMCKSVTVVRVYAWYE